MDRKVFLTLVAFSFLAFLLYLLYAILAPFGEPLIWAAVVGTATFPLYERLHRLLGGRDFPAATLMTLAVVLLLVIPFVGILLFLAKEAAQAYQFLEEARAGGTTVTIEGLQRHPAVAPWLERAAPYLRDLNIDLRETVLPAAKEAISSLLGYATRAVKNVVLFLLRLVLMLIVLFFVYKDGRGLQERFWAALPIGEETRRVVRGTVKRVVSAVVVGILATCIVQGLLGGFGFWFSGLPSPVLFGTVMSITALIPVVGTALVWLPGAAYLLLTGETVKGVILLVWGALAVSSIDNLLRPLLMSGRAGLPIPVMALGALGGLAAFGLIGVIIGPLVLAVFLVLFEVYAERPAVGGGDEPPLAGPPPEEG